MNPIYIFKSGGKAKYIEDDEHYFKKKKKIK